MAKDAVKAASADASDHDQIPEVGALMERAEDFDVAYLFAAGINLHSEAMRRRAGRLLYGPADVQRLLKLIDLVINVPHAMLRPVQKDKERAPAPSVGEEIAVLAAQLTDMSAAPKTEKPAVVASAS